MEENGFDEAGVGIAQTVNLRHGEKPNLMSSKPKAKPRPKSKSASTSKLTVQPEDIEVRNRQRANSLRKDFPGMKDIPTSVSKSQMKRLVAAFKATYQQHEQQKPTSKPKIRNRSQDAKTVEVRKSGQTAGAPPDLPRSRGKGGLSIEDAINID